ncbi:hypothetical protein F5884DRAFT_326974 [Xylogone sp. PMI_703]|nr:hypothetical protein F5884DRAFT_326974 [Xylogone sp. PMI_703]
MPAPSEDKLWAQKYILDPLTAPEPHQEDGPGTHFRPSPEPSPSPSPDPFITGNRSEIPKTPSNPSRNSARYPTPPNSASPRESDFHPSNPFSQAYRSSHSGAPSTPTRSSHTRQTSSASLSLPPVRERDHRRRGSSLGERFPGDVSHRPLDILRQEAKMAHRAPHLRRKHRPGADTIDALDDSMGVAYHHEGPYDATLLARNTSYNSSPVAATMGTNRETLKATPKEFIRDALDKHVPLQGTAIIPSGAVGMDGNVMDYEEGIDMMRDPTAGGGAYKRWEGQQYHPDDLKGKGEPSFSIERALKESKQGKQCAGMEGIELLDTNKSRRRSSSLAATPSTAADNGNVRRSTSVRVGEGLKRRFGSIRRLGRHTD